MNEPNQSPTESTQLVIPYFDGDRGLPDRPVAVWYYCPSIIVSGTPNRFEFTPGMPMSVTVEVTNVGAGTSVTAASVVVWWAEPTTGGFVEKTWFGQDVIRVPSHGKYVAKTKPITNTLPIDAPQHLCLLAQATALASSSTSDGTPDPINEPHWAQFNLTAQRLHSDETHFSFSWLAGNPGTNRASYQLRVQPADVSALERLTEVLQARPVNMPDMTLSIDEGDGTSLPLTLDGREQRRLHLSGDLVDSLEQGTFTAVEVAQYDVTNNPDGVPVGAIGLLLLAETG